MTAVSMIRAACLVLAMVAPSVLADDAEKPKPSQEIKPGLKIKIEGGDDKITFIPKPATQPATAPVAAHISDDAKPLIEEMAAAYKDLKSLELVGTFSGDIDAAGQHTGGTIHFTSTFLAPNLFSHKGVEDVLVGFSGEKFYAYAPSEKSFALIDGPKEKKERIAVSSVPAGVRQVLVDQDPSLLLALSKDPAAELEEDVKDISKVADTEIDGISCPTLKLAVKDKVTVVIAIDPKLHLIRKATTDFVGLLEARKIPKINIARYTVIYTTIRPDADAKAEQFAFAPPADGKEAREPAPLAAAADGAPAADALVGKDVPDFSFKTLDGKTVTRADLKGSVYILDLWATWCGPCRASLPHLTDLYNQLKGDGLKVYAINIGEEKAKVQKFVDDTKLGVPVLLDPESASSDKFKVEGIPETLVVGKDGKVVKVVIGFMPQGAPDAPSTPEVLKKAVEAAMKK